MVIKRVGPLSIAKLMGVMYLFIGLLFAGFLTLVATIGRGFGVSPNPQFGAMSFLGPLAFVVLPLLYGAMGFIVGLISGALYNVIAGWTGGVEIETQ